MIELFKGEEALRRVKGKKRKATPFVGVIGEGDPRHSYLGAGILSEKGEVLEFCGNLFNHNLPASYRAMNIAEKIDVFKESNTMVACAKYAGIYGEGSVKNPFNTLDDLDFIVGPAVLERIMNSKIQDPEFDSAIDILIENKVDVGIIPIINEVKSGRLDKTPAIEKAISHYSNLELLLKSLSKRYRKSMDALRDRFNGDKGKAEDYPAHEQAASEYILVAQKMMPELIREIQSGYQNLEAKMKLLHSNSKCFEKNYIDAKKEAIAELQEKARNAIESLKNLPIKDLSVAEKFLSYHESLQRLVGSISKISFNLSSMPGWPRNDCKKPDDECKKCCVEYQEIFSGKNNSDLILEKVNSSIKGYMPNAYSLNN